MSSLFGGIIGVYVLLVTKDYIKEGTTTAKIVDILLVCISALLIFYIIGKLYTILT